MTLVILLTGLHFNWAKFSKRHLSHLIFSLQLHLLVAFSSQTAHLLLSSLWVPHLKETIVLKTWYQECSQVGVLTTRFLKYV